MANTLSEFVQHIKKNSIARVNRFRVHFSTPEGVDTGETGEDAEKIISLTCLMAEVPGRQEQTSEIGYGNYRRKIVYGRSTNDFTTTFLVTGKYAEKKLFDSWHGMICDESQTAVEYYDNYIASIMVECLNEQDEVVYSFELTEAYPIAVSSIRLDRTAQNQQMVIDVAWAYHRMKNLPDLEPKLPQDSQAQVPPIVPGLGSGKNRLVPIPGIDSFSSAVQTTITNVKEFRGQLQGVLRIAKDVREQVRDAKMTVIDGVKTLNGVVKDVKAIVNIPNDVKNEVIEVINGVKNQIGYLKGDINSISNYPKK